MKAESRREPELLSVGLTNVAVLGSSPKVARERVQLLVGLVVREVGDGDAVLELRGEGKDRIVDDQNLFQVPTSKDAQVLHEDTFIGTLNLITVVSVEAVGYQTAVGIELVEYWVCVLSKSCRKNDHLVVLVCRAQTFPRKWSNVDVHLLRKWHGG